MRNRNREILLSESDLHAGPAQVFISYFDPGYTLAISAAYVTARWWRKAWTGILAGIRMYDECIRPCAQLLRRDLCISVCAAQRANISASAGDPCCHFIQTWSQPNTKIRTCCGVYVSSPSSSSVQADTPDTPGETIARESGVGSISRKIWRVSIGKYTRAPTRTFAISLYTETLILR